MVNKTIKSVIYLVLSVLVISILWGIVPKMINLMDTGYEKYFAILFYWLGLLTVLGVPQYCVWFLEEEIDFLAPIKSTFAFLVSIMTFMIVSVVTDKLFNVITLSTMGGIIFTICFWLFAVLIMYVPQVFVYEPLKERFT